MNRYNTKLLCHNSFIAFASCINQELNPERDLYRQKWALVGCDFVEEIIKSDDITGGIINMPSRLGKTTLFTILFACWYIGKYPSRKILVITSSAGTRDSISNSIQDVLFSKTYKYLFPNIVFPRNNIEYKTTNFRGKMTFKVSGSNIIGEGAHLILFDDYCDPYKLSTHYHESAMERLRGFIGRTEHNPETKFIVTEQRLAYNDTTGFFKTIWSESGRRFRNLLLEYECSERKEYKISSSNTKIVFNQGEFLDAKFNSDSRDKLIVEIGIENYMARYQQNPIVQDGEFFKKEYIKYEDNVNLIQFDSIYLSFDTAYKDKSWNDPTACVVFGVKNEKIYVIDSIVRRMEYAVIEKFVLSIIEKYRSLQCDICILIEDAGSGQALISNLKKNYNIPGIIPIPARTGKNNRLQMGISALRTYLESGCFLIDRYGSWRVKYENELLDFPNVIHDDQIDCTSQFFNYYSTRIPMKITDTVRFL